MDKNSYETYKYLPTDESESNQFFVVQDDGTFLSVNKDIQYVTQVQDVKEVLEGVESCAVYDVSSQQFLIDVHNSADLISVPDQFILPEGENNIFGNNYLLPVPNCTEKQAEQQDEINQYQEPETQMEDVEIQSHRQIDNCTEITLSDDQYHTLEQKGWILLEINDKVFILDTLGLHDITSNDKLIQKLKSENESSIGENDLSLSNQEDPVQFVIAEDDIKLTEEIIQEDDSLLNNVENVECVEVSSPDAESLVDNVSDEPVPLSSVKTSVSNNIFKVKTDILFKDIPNKVVLGETEKGKKLFAKITKLNNKNGRKAIEIPPRSNIKEAQKKYNYTINNKTNQKSPLNNSTLDDNQFQTLLRLALQNRDEVKCSSADVASADSIVTQLLKVPAFKPSVLNRNLIITKVSVQEDTGANSNGGSPVLVTGRVTSLNDNRYYFVHLPGMLAQLMNRSADNEKNVLSQPNVHAEDKNILHVHVTELKRADNVLRISITLNKRQLTDNTNISVDNKRKQLSMVFGCSACATVFQTENELNEHQMTQCKDVDKTLAIDLEQSVKGYTVEKNGKEKTYSCNNCNAKFTKSFNCLKHLKTHFTGANKMNNAKKTKSDSNSVPMDGLYKCKMCSSSYLHPSTLSKHIVSKHIKVNNN